MWTWPVHHKGWQRGVADDHCAGSLNHGEASAGNRVWRISRFAAVNGGTTQNQALASGSMPPTLSQRTRKDRAPPFLWCLRKSKSFSCLRFNRDSKPVWRISRFAAVNGGTTQNQALASGSLPPTLAKKPQGLIG